ncbi:MAG: glycosyltransferase family 4 protein, partial [Chloroflexi bacterium]|nr:glycosyltransferase family 4 protein [Chloroflexota bacterium]
MHIGIDASRAAVKRRTGTENYSLHLIRSLLEIAGADGGAHARDRFTLYFNQPPADGLLPSLPRCAHRVMPFPRLWTHVRLSIEMQMHAPDILFVPAHVLPLRHPKRSVVTVHDLGYLYYPKAHTAWDRKYLRYSTAYNARAASRIIADSEATKSDIVKQLNVVSDRVAVIYPGVGEEFFQPVSSQRMAQVAERYALSGSYIVYVGTLQPRKNLRRLVEAYAKLRERGDVDARLVIAGKVGWFAEETMQHLSKVSRDVTITGFVPEEDLPALYAGATALIMPSLFEGFGMPVVEAMACGTPVVAARAGALPEVVGDAGVLVDPLDIDSIADGIGRVVSDRKLQARLRQKGLERAKRFTWQRAAQEVLTL